MNLEMRAVSACYKGDVREDVLHEVSMQARAGRVLAIVGPNGCGKSTLLRVACGLLAPRVGEVRVGDRSISDLDSRERARLFALLPQHPTVPQSMTCREMVALGRTPHLGPYATLSPRDEEIVARALERVGASEMSHRKAEELSGGQRQRIFMARALAQKAPFLLLDEPIAHLDLKFQFQILKLARDLARTPSSTSGASNTDDLMSVVVVLHHINLAASIADEMILMSRGRVVASGAPAEVMREQVLEEVFEVPLSVSPHPMSGRPQAQGRWDFEEA